MVRRVRHLCFGNGELVVEKCTSLDEIVEFGEPLCRVRAEIEDVAQRVTVLASKIGQHAQTLFDLLELDRVVDDLLGGTPGATAEFGHRGIDIACELEQRPQLRVELRCLADAGEHRADRFEAVLQELSGGSE